MEALIKNLWILVTIVLPGLFTYGTWRILLILSPSSILNPEVLSQVDNSNLLSWSIIFSIALLQQSVGLVIEFLCYLFFCRKELSYKKFHSLFCKRFEYAKEGKINEYVSSQIGNFFLSLNVFIGTQLLLIYFLFYEKIGITHWVILFLFVSALTTILNVVFRLKTTTNLLKSKSI